MSIWFNPIKAWKRRIRSRRRNASLVYVAAYSKGPIHRNYEFLISRNRADLEKAFGGSKPFAIKALPAHLGEELAGSLIGQPTRRLGNITFYRSTNDLSLAYSHHYTPKVIFPTLYSRGPGKLIGLSYFVESMCVNDLKRIGVRQVSTSDPNKFRRAQLERVSLPINEPVPIREWQRGMGRGIKSGLEWAEKEASEGKMK
jgi:hypothetical protein